MLCDVYVQPFCSNLVRGTSGINRIFESNKIITKKALIYYMYTSENPFIAYLYCFIAKLHTHMLHTHTHMYAHMHAHTHTNKPINILFYGNLKRFDHLNSHDIYIYIYIYRVAPKTRPTF